jgi:hypothetical protein
MNLNSYEDVVVLFSLQKEILLNIKYRVDGLCCDAFSYSDELFCQSFVIENVFPLMVLSCI